MAPLLAVLDRCLVSWAPTRPGKPIRRPRRRFALHLRGCWHHPGHAYGRVDLGGTKVQGVIVGDDGARLGEARGKTPVGEGAAAVVAEIATVVKAAAKDAKAAPRSRSRDRDRLPGRGRRGHRRAVRGGQRLRGGDRVPLGAMVADAVGVERVVVDNDVVVATSGRAPPGGRPGLRRPAHRLRRVGVGGALSWGAGRPAPTGPPARSATWWWSTAASCAPAAAAAAWRPTPAGSPWSARPGRPRRRPPDRAAGHPGAPGPPPDDQRGLEGGPGRRRPAGPRADRPGHRGPGRGHRPRPTGRRPGRLDRRRPGRQAGEPFVRRVETAMVPHLFLPPPRWWSARRAR